MSLTDRAGLKAALDSTGLPVALGSWRPGGAPDPPYLVYRAADSAVKRADGRPWRVTTLYDVELYCELHARDAALEGAVEAALDGAGIPWSKSFPGDIEDQRMTETCWTVQVLGD